tara:strand:- start:218 stop:604 length:387 start_codon:yes stop_codon:yes gene_type:complete
VGKAEAHHRGALDRVGNVGDSDHVLGELGTLQVLDVLVLLVDDLRERHAVDHLLVHVHAHLIVKDGVAQRVLAEDAHKRGAEVARSDHCDLLSPSRSREAAPRNGQCRAEHGGLVCRARGRAAKAQQG